MEKLLVIFDLDGTLIDTIADVGKSCNKALQHYDFPTHDISYYESCVGGNLETFIAKILPPSTINEENINKVKKLYREFYKKHCCDATEAYKGVLDVLVQLREDGHKIAVNTNKGQGLSELVLHKIFKGFSFDDVVGYVEEYPHKPDPSGVHRIIEKLEWKNKACVYVGDTITDLRTAENANIPCIYCTWGQGNANDIELSTPKYIVQNPYELLVYIKREAEGK